ncbi:hypothetical protein ABZS76_16340 [Streptomyces sp. NPDC005562]|uniref:DUF6959 family protein n=1 Tax=Streptomyces sp. NPDC005562 TaxID=3154890 RepID=UPI0033A3C788
MNQNRRFARQMVVTARMERIEAELFTDPGNDAVVRLPPRRFPGMLIQGDVLSIVRADVAEMLERSVTGGVISAIGWLPKRATAPKFAGQLLEDLFGGAPMRGAGL